MKLGVKQVLTVVKIVDFGVYLGSDEERVLLPKKQVPADIELGDPIEVFLYKDSSDGRYQLVLHQSEYSPEEFNKVCNILSEYGSGRAFSAAGEAHLKEHGELISSSALQQLTQL